MVIGRRASLVDEADALSYVAGAMPFNDVSARDLQLQNPLWTSGKAIDTFAPCGPALVTLEEAGDLGSLQLRTRINGKVVQEGSTANLIFGVAAAVAWLSRTITLEPWRHHRHRHPRRRGRVAGNLPARRRHGRGGDRRHRCRQQSGAQGPALPHGCAAQRRSDLVRPRSGQPGPDRGIPHPRAGFRRRAPDGEPRSRTSRCGFGDRRVTDTPVPRGAAILGPCGPGMASLTCLRAPPVFVGAGAPAWRRPPRLYWRHSGVQPRPFPVYRRSSR